MPGADSCQGGETSPQLIPEHGIRPDRGWMRTAGWMGSTAALLVMVPMVLSDGAEAESSSVAMPGGTHADTVPAVSSTGGPGG